MISFTELSDYALSFCESEEKPHFEILSFRVKNKVFVTINKSENRACLKLNLIDQDVFCKTNKEIFYPVPNSWGKHGGTLVNLKKVKKSVIKDAITCAYCNVAPKKLATKYN